MTTGARLVPALKRVLPIIVVVVAALSNLLQLPSAAQTHDLLKSSPDAYVIEGSVINFPRFRDTFAWYGHRRMIPGLGRFRPLTDQLWWLEWQAFGDHYTAWTTVTTLLFCALCVAHYCFVLSMFASRPLALVSALCYSQPKFWLVHRDMLPGWLISYPIQEVLLATLIATCGWLALDRWLREERPRSLALAALGFLVALLFHEQAYCFGLVLLCVVLQRRLRGPYRMLLPLTGMMLLFLFAFLWRRWALEGEGHLPSLFKMITRPVVLLTYPLVPLLRIREWFLPLFTAALVMALWLGWRFRHRWHWSLRGLAGCALVLMAMLVAPDPLVQWWYRPFTRTLQLFFWENEVFLAQLIAVVVTGVIWWRHRAELGLLLTMLVSAIATLPSERWWYHFMTLFFWIPFYLRCAFLALDDVGVGRSAWAAGFMRVLRGNAPPAPRSPACDR